MYRKLINIANPILYISGFQLGFHGTLGLLQCSLGAPPELAQMSWLTVIFCWLVALGLCSSKKVENNDKASSLTRFLYMKTIILPGPQFS